MLVHIPPAVHFKAEGSVGGLPPAAPSREFLQVLQAVVESGYYTPDPAEACLFVPALDLMSEAGLNSSLVSAALAQSSKWWNKGRNHVVFTPYPAADSNIDLGTQNRNFISP